MNTVYIFPKEDCWKFSNYIITNSSGLSAQR